MHELWINWLHLNDFTFEWKLIANYCLQVNIIAHLLKKTWNGVYSSFRYYMYVATTQFIELQKYKLWGKF